MDIGYAFVVVALLSSAIAFISFIRYLREQENASYRFARAALIIQSITLTAAISILLYYFLSRDFNVEYVASYSDRGLSLAYTISALWGGAPGSLLLWSWLLSLFITIISLREKKDKLTGYALAILLTISMFFISMLITFL